MACTPWSRFHNEHAAEALLSQTGWGEYIVLMTFPDDPVTTIPQQVNELVLPPLCVVDEWLKKALRAGNPLFDIHSLADNERLLLCVTQTVWPPNLTRLSKKQRHWLPPNTKASSLVISQMIFLR